MLNITKEQDFYIDHIQGVQAFLDGKKYEAKSPDERILKATLEKVAIFT